MFGMPSRMKQIMQRHAVFMAMHVQYHASYENENAQVMGFLTSTHLIRIFILIQCTQNESINRHTL